MKRAERPGVGEPFVFGTERLARTLVASLEGLTARQADDSVHRLTRAFQSAWIDEMLRQTSEARPTGS